MVNLNFELPIEIPFMERFEIAIKNKILSLLNKVIFNDSIYFGKYLNLFKNDLKELKINQNNPNNSEIIKIKSSINFNLLGIGIPKILNKDKSVEVNIYNQNTLLEKITKFENNDNLSIFHSNLIEIKNNDEYSIEIKGIDGLNYIDNEEEYNDISKIDINSNNQETILSCIIIE